MKLTFKHTKLACYSGYITQAVVNNFTPLLFVFFGTGFGLSISQIASLITINFTTQILVDIFGARYAEKIGYRTVLVMSQLMAAAGMILLGVLPYILNPYFGLIIAVIIYAIGSGLTEVMVSPVIEALPGDAKASSMSLLHSFYCWGCVYTIGISTLFFSIFGLENWRYLSFYWAVLPTITAILFAKVPINVFGEEGGKRMRFREFFRSGLFWIFILLMVCSGASEMAMSQWSSMFAETSLHVSKNVGDILGPCLFAVFMGCARVIYGRWGEKMNLKKCMSITAVLCVVGYAVVSLVPVPMINLLGCSICGFASGLMWPGVMSLAAKSFPAGGTAMFGLLALSGDIGCFSGPEVVAIVSEHSTLKTGLLAAAIFPVVMIVLMGILRKKRK